MSEPIWRGNRTGLHLHSSARETKRFGPKRSRRVDHLEDLANGTGEVIKLVFACDQGRSDLQDHEIIPADLRKDALLAKQAHHEHLPEETFMDTDKGFEREAQPHAARRLELDTGKHAEAADVLHHFELAQFQFQPAAEAVAEQDGARTELLRFENVQRGKARAHR